MGADVAMGGTGSCFVTSGAAFPGLPFMRTPWPLLHLLRLRRLARNTLTDSAGNAKFPPCFSSLEPYKLRVTFASPLLAAIPHSHHDP
jgi:hypothetical protein